jgi:hypothetical protein
MRGQVPTNDKLARLLGLEDWRIGCHSRKGGKDSSFWVHYLWRVLGNPSFHPGFVIAGIQADDWIEEPGSGPPWRKAVFACGAVSKVVSLRMDPIARALNRIELVPPLGRLGLDGVGYFVSFSSDTLEGQLSFWNPEHPPLLALERSLLRLGQRIAKVSGSRKLQECAHIWGRYCRDRGPVGRLNKG